MAKHDFFIELGITLFVLCFVFACIAKKANSNTISKQYDAIVSEQCDMHKNNNDKYVDILMNKYKVSYKDYKHVMNVWQYEIDKFTKHNNRMKFDVIKFLAETYYPMVFESEFFKRYNENHVDVTTYFEIENNTLRFKSVITSLKCKGSSVVTYDIAI